MRNSTNRSRTVSFVIGIVLALTSLPSLGSAQSAGSPFTVDDLLDVTNINLADLSDDGRWLAATSGSLRDRIGIDNHRFGDPTYVAPKRTKRRLVIRSWIGARMEKTSILFITRARNGSGDLFDTPSKPGSSKTS
jgi:hypothetical protein